jgi:hypothetical protein
MKNQNKINFLSLAIAAIAITVISLFFMPWVEDPASEGERVLTGVDVAVQSTFLTDELIPSGILWIIPLVAFGLLYQNLRRISSLYRPRQRLTFAGSMIIGIAAFAIWAIVFAGEAAACLREGVECAPLTPEQSTFTRQDIIEEFYTTNMQIYIALTLMLVVLPFWDRRPEAPKQD